MAAAVEQNGADRDPAGGCGTESPDGGGGMGRIWSRSPPQHRGSAGIPRRAGARGPVVPPPSPPPPTLRARYLGRERWVGSHLRLAGRRLREWPNRGCLPARTRTGVGPVRPTKGRGPRALPRGRETEAAAAAAAPSQRSQTCAGSRPAALPPPRSRNKQRNAIVAEQTKGASSRGSGKPGQGTELAAAGPLPGRRLIPGCQQRALQWAEGSRTNGQLRLTVMKIHLY